ncbi:MAG: hypothetical protein ACLFN8_03145 [Candidatus Woesearchaeota archaeon]
MNKKADWKQIRTIVITIILLGVILHFTGAFKAMGKNTFNTLKSYDPNRDFDGDEIPDGRDECPCGSPENNLNYISVFDGITKCIKDFNPCNEELEGNFGFKTETDARDRTVCTYRKASCLEYIDSLEE